MIFIFVLLLVLAAYFGNIKKCFQFQLDVAAGSKAKEVKPDSLHADFKYHGRGSSQRSQSIHNNETSEDIRQQETTLDDNKQDSEKAGLPPPHQTMLEKLEFTQVPSNGLNNSLRTSPPVDGPPELREDGQFYKTPMLKKKTVYVETFDQKIEQNEDSNLPDKESSSTERMRKPRYDGSLNIDHPAGRTFGHDEYVVTGEPLSRNAASVIDNEQFLEVKTSLEEESKNTEYPALLDPVECPYLRIGTEHDEETENVTCVPHKPSEKECQEALKFYELDRKPLTCSSKPQASLCSFKETWRSAKTDKLSLKCDLSQCSRNPLHVIALDPNTGMLKDREKWHKFASTKGLEDFLSSFVITTSKQGFNFCFLACRSKDGEDYIEQILYFPPVMAKPTNRVSQTGFNVNILVLDSVSRPHFYRSLPQTVDSLRGLARDDYIRTKVLDFELLQSSAAHTFQNIRALMSGNSYQKKAYGIEVLFGKFQRKEYYTVLQEDSCWFDSWGSLVTNNLYQGKKPSNKLEFYERWQSFQSQVREYFVDDYGLSYTPCEVFRKYNTTNQFNQPRRVCFGGKVFAEFFLDYVESVYVASKTSGNLRSIFSYTHLNLGHEVTGRRIRQIDKHLSEFVRKMAKYQDTLTIVLSDHGPKTTKYAFNTMEGRTEVYNPLLFMIIPETVQRVLGKERMKALKINQRRLFSTLEIHEALMSIGEGPEADPYRQSIFTVIPANRTCGDLNLKPSAVCKCEGWEERFSEKNDSFLWMAELGLGTLNNQIQQQYLSGEQKMAGFGNCQRLVGKTIAKVRRRTHGDQYIATMDLLVKPKNQIFEIQVRYPKKTKGNGVASLSFSRRITIYRHFSRCVDKTVNVRLCVCQFDKQKKDLNTKWEQIPTIAKADSFHATTKVQDLHDGCLLFMIRKHGPNAHTKVVEASNACVDRRYTINVSAQRIEDVIVSRELPFSLILLPRTIHFLFSVYHLQEPYSFRISVDHIYEVVNGAAHANERNVLLQI